MDDLDKRLAKAEARAVFLSGVIRDIRSVNKEWHYVAPEILASRIATDFARLCGAEGRGE